MGSDFDRGTRLELRLWGALRTSVSGRQRRGAAGAVLFGVPLLVGIKTFPRDRQRFACCSSGPFRALVRRVGAQQSFPDLATVLALYTSATRDPLYFKLEKASVAEMVGSDAPKVYAPEDAAYDQFEFIDEQRKRCSIERGVMVTKVVAAVLSIVHAAGHSRTTITRNDGRSVTRSLFPTLALLMVHAQ